MTLQSAMTFLAIRLSQLSTPPCNPEDACLRDEVHRRMHSAVRRLSPKLRRVIEVQNACDARIEEIARGRNVPADSGSGQVSSEFAFEAKMKSPLPDEREEGFGWN